MIVCKYGDGFVPLEITVYPNCDSKIGQSSSKVQQVKMIVSGIASLSVSMTLKACYEIPPISNETRALIALLAISDSSNFAQVVITAPNDQGTLTIESGQNKFLLLPGKKSKAFYLYPQLYNYKITNSSNNVIFEDKEFNFLKSSKDGIIIKSEANIGFAVSNICYNLNGILDKQETITCSDL